MSRHKRERSSSFLLSVAGATLVIQFLTLASGPLLARMLGPSGRGEVAVVLATIVLCGLVGAGGLPTAAARLVGEAGSPARDVLHGVLLRFALWALVPALVGSGIAWLLLADSSDRAGIAVVSGVLTWLWSWQFMLGGMLRGEGSMRKVNTQRILGTLLYVAAVTIAFFTWPGITAVEVMVLYAACFPVTLAVSWWMLDRPTHDPSVRADRAELTRESRSSFGGTIGGVDSLGLDILLIGAVLGTTPLGLYAVARTVTTFPVLVLDPLAANLLPRLAAVQGAARRSLERKWLKIVLLVALAMFVSLQLVIWPVLHYLFGPEFVDATTCARLLILGLTLTGLRRVLQAMLQARGRAGVGSRVEVVSSVLMLAGMAAGAHFGGLNWATAALPLVSGVSLVALVVLLARFGDVDVATPAGVDVEDDARHQLVLDEGVEGLGRRADHAGRHSE